jgi:Immunity protein 50
MSGIEDKIRGSQLLTNIFGHWPSFLDAEVISFELKRDAAGVSEPWIRSKICLFEMPREIDGKPVPVPRNRVHATFLFAGIDELSLAEFNQQNALRDLFMHDISSRQMEKLKFEVHFDSSFGLEARFKCRNIEVETVVAAGPRDDAPLPRQSPHRTGAYKPD